MEDSQKGSPHSSLQLGEFEGTFYKFYEILIFFCVTVFLVSLLLLCLILGFMSLKSFDFRSCFDYSFYFKFDF